MNLSVNTNSSIPPFTQIQSQIRCAVARGDLKPGDQLPSVRELAKEFRLNPNTVAKAYRDLELTGIVYTEWGKGVFAAKDAVALSKRQLKREFIERMYRTVREAKDAALSKTEFAEIVNACWSVQGEAYGEVPKKVLKLAG